MIRGFYNGKNEEKLIVNISKIEYDNLNLLKQYLPKKKKKYSDKEKEVIQKYNDYIEQIVLKKEKSKNIKIDIILEKIDI